MASPRAAGRADTLQLYALGLMSLLAIWIPAVKGSLQPLSLKLTGLSLFFLVASVRLVQRVISSSGSAAG